MRRTLQVALVVVVAVAAFIMFLKLRYSGKAPVKLSAESCNAELWKHVYQPERLLVIEVCTVVEGRVAGIHRASDGDIHIALDPENKSVLNLVNLIHRDGELVVEAVCEHAPADAEGMPSKVACEGFTSQVTVPAVGDRVRVTGAYVSDTDNGWNEIHPVTRIEVLR